MELPVTGEQASFTVVCQPSALDRGDNLALRLAELEVVVAVRTAGRRAVMLFMKGGNQYRIKMSETMYREFRQALLAAREADE
jgi:hypothetical protein